MTFVTIILLNTVTGILIGIVKVAKKGEQAAIIQDEMDQTSDLIRSFNQIFNEMDVNESGGISLDEFDMALANEKMASLLGALKLEINDMKGLFELLDRDYTGQVDVEEFIFG